MKNFQYPLFALIFTFLLSSCAKQDETSSAFTGRTIQYQMISGAYFDQTTTGTVTVKEKADGNVQVEIDMDGTLDGANHPVHLHNGSLLEDETVAQYLSPLVDEGDHHSVSVTDLLDLNDQPVSFDDFQKMNASIKVHFRETGDLSNVILGATNIGVNYSEDDINTLDQSVTTCNQF